MKAAQNSARSLNAFSLIFFLGLALRILMLLSEKSLWGDEFYSLDYAGGVDPFEIIRYAAKTNHPPLYYLFLDLAVRILGENEIAFRALSFIAGLAMIWLTYRLGKQLFGRQAGLVGAFLVAVSPYFLQSSNEIRSYSFLGAVSAAALIFYSKYLKKDRYLIYAVLFLAMVPYVEHMGIFLVTGVLTHLFFTDRRKATVPFLVLALLLAPWVWLVTYQAIYDEKVFQVSRVQEYWKLTWQIKKATAVFWHMIAGYQFSMLTTEDIARKLKSSPFFWAQAIYVSANVFLFCKGSIHALFRRRKEFGLMICVFALPLLFLFLAYPIRLSARYLTFSAPIFFVFWAYGLCLIRQSFYRGVILLLILAASLQACIYSIRLVTDPIHKEDYKGLVSHVLSKARSGDVICGLSVQVRYYAEQPVSKGGVVVVPELVDLNPQVTRSAERVWVLDQLNMHESVWRKNYEQIKLILGRLGFVPSQEPHRYGGEEGLVVFYLFERG